MVFNDEHKILIKRLYLKEYTAKRLTDEFSEKSWTKHGVSKLFKTLRDTGTVDRRPGSGRQRSARTEENVETVNDLVLSQDDKPQSHSTIREILRETSRPIRRWTENAICLHFLRHLLDIYRKFELLISQGSVTTCLR